MGKQLMSGRIYDLSGKDTCKKCGRDMSISSENNFNGSSCKRKKCDRSLLDAEYDQSIVYAGTLSFELKKIDQDGEKKAQH